MFSTTYRPAPTLGGSAGRNFRARGATPESLVDAYLHSQQSPRVRQQGRRPMPQMVSAPMDPESWWRLYVLSTHVRGASTLHQSYEKEPWTDSLRSPRSSPRSSPGAPPSPRTRSLQQHARPAPQLPPGSHRRPAPQLQQRRRMGYPSTYPVFRQDTAPKEEPKSFSSIGVQADAAGEGIVAARPAPVLPGEEEPTAQEMREVQKVLVDKLTSKYKDLRKAFRTFDRDSSGAITKEEMMFGLSIANLNTVRKSYHVRAFRTLVRRHRR